MLSFVFHCLAVLMALFMAGTCNNKQKDYFNVRHIQSNGLPFKIAEPPPYGAGFYMRDDRGRKTPRLYTASTPFPVDRAGEERSFAIEVGQGGRPDGDAFTFYLRIDFNVAEYAEVARLTALESPWKNNTCVEVGEPLSFYIRITESDGGKLVFEKTESHVCAVTHINKESILKHIVRTRLNPGVYKIYVRSEIGTPIFQKYAASFYVRQTY